MNGSRPAPSAPIAGGAWGSGRSSVLRALVGVEDHVVAVGVGRPEAVDALGRELFLGHDLAQAAAGRRRNSRRASGPTCGIVEDLRIFPPQLPRLEERRPVDVGDEFLEWLRIDHAAADEGRLVDPHGRPVGLEAAGQRVGVRHERSLLPVGELLAVALLRLGGSCGRTRASSPRRAGSRPPAPRPTRRSNGRPARHTRVRS